MPLCNSGEMWNVDNVLASSNSTRMWLLGNERRYQLVKSSWCSCACSSTTASRSSSRCTASDSDSLLTAPSNDVVVVWRWSTSKRNRAVDATSTRVPQLTPQNTPPHAAAVTANHLHPVQPTSFALNWLLASIYVVHSFFAYYINTNRTDGQSGQAD